MQLDNDDRRYGIIARLFHWVVALLVFSLLPLGWYMHDLPLGLERYRYVELHKSLGLLVLLAMIGRSLWRIFNPPPALPDELPGWEILAAKLTHWALYGALFAQVFIGMILVWAANSPLLFFGWFALPSPIEADKPLRHLMEEMHELLALAIVALLAAHIGAALRHHFILKNDILRRMLSVMLIFGFALLAAPAGAAPWNVQPSSRLLFHFTQSSVAYTGAFERFEARIEFDPEKPEEGRIDVKIDIASLDTQNAERDAVLKSPEIFDAEKFPQAQFTADKIRALTPGQFEAPGTLTIKDISLPLVLPFSLLIDKNAANGDTAQASGTVVISRRDFGLAQGKWEATDIVADEVKIEIRVEAVRER
jgi:cytochrome b561